MFKFFCFQVSKPSQEAYQNELNIESIERSFILSARSALPVCDAIFNTVWIDFQCRWGLTCFLSVFCSSATERDEWLEAIAKAIDDYTKKKTTFISSRSQEEVKQHGLLMKGLAT